MSKKVMAVVAVVALVAILGICLVACNAESYEKKLEKAGYTVTSMSAEEAKEEGARGQGVGKALYEFAIGYARENGCYDVTLNVWEGNNSARAFYEKMGMFPKETQMEYIL